MPSQNNAGGSGSGEGASPLADFADEHDEEMMDVSQHHLHHSYHPHPLAGGGGAVAAEMGGVVLDVDGNGIDLDSTVGGKRKR
jgi:hypothetical protein